MMGGHPGCLGSVLNEVQGRFRGYRVWRMRISESETIHMLILPVLFALCWEMTGIQE